MCGRFAFYSPAEATAALFGVNGTLAVEPGYNIAPTQYVAAIRDGQEHQRELVMLRWGLVPFWAKDPAIGNRMINARAETVAEKPSFRAAFRHRRCLVLADGYYEWHRDGDVKTPYYISMASGEPFAFAALWENWNDKETGESLQTTTLITMAANSFLERVHNRMPLIVQADTADIWMSAAGNSLEEVAARMPPLRAWPVSRRVNNARNQGADLIDVAGELLH
jgi:putative SOS response-associated peptidase YedK